MHSRRLACFLLGLWLAGDFFMAWVATENLRSVDRLFSLANPAATVRVKVLGNADARLLLRYQAAEQNRYYFEAWETAQIVMGSLFFFFLLFGTGEGKFSLTLSLMMLVLVLGQRFLLTPEIVSLGRITDFLPPNEATGDRTKFWVLHSFYVGVELAKWAMGFLLAAILIGRRTRRSGNSGQQFNVVNKANYGHIDR